MRPSSSSSGMEPRRWATTGVPVASASTTDRPKGSSKSMRCSRAVGPAQQGVPIPGADRTEVGDLRPVDVGADLLLEVALVLHDPRDPQRHTGPAGHLDGVVRPLVGVDAAQEQQVGVVGRVGHGREGRRVDPVVDRRGVREVGVPVGVTDGDVVADVVERLVDRHDPLGGEPVDRRHDGGVDEPAVAERQEVELVGDDVELAGAPEGSGEVERLPDLDVEATVLLVAGGG